MTVILALIIYFLANQILATIHYGQNRVQTHSRWLLVAGQKDRKLWEQDEMCSTCNARVHKNDNYNCNFNSNITIHYDISVKNAIEY